MTEAAPPNFRMSNEKPPPGGRAPRPGKCVHSPNDGQSCTRMKADRQDIEHDPQRWVSNWKRLIQVMPWVTSGITTTALTT